MATSNPNPRPKWDVHNPHSKAGQKFVTTMRKIYNPIGFHKGYNFPLFIIGVGGLMGFTLSRMFYWNIDGIFSKDVAPGEWYYYRAGRHRVGIIMHLIGAIAGGFLACFQFIPIIRYKAILFHRLNGYAAIILLLIGNTGAYMIMTVSMGGQTTFQLWVGLVGAMITIGFALAIYNIKRLQIDQHRAWMLRVWTWAASIATLRLILLAGMHCARAYGYVYHVSFMCAQIYEMYEHVGVPARGNPTGKLYPACNVVDTISGIPTGQQINPSRNTATYVSVSSLGTGPENVAAMIHAIFPMAGWLAIFIHALIIEIYLWLTPAESYRLRNVSYEKQIEKGYRVRGSFKDAGLTGTRIGDAPEWWSIPSKDYEYEKARRGLGVDEGDTKKMPGDGSDPEQSEGSSVTR